MLYDEGLSYTFVTHNNLYLLAVSRTNVNALSTLSFLHRLVDVFKHYFEARRPASRLLPACLQLCLQVLDEESLRDNFVIGARPLGRRRFLPLASLTRAAQCTSCSMR